MAIASTVIARFEVLRSIAAASITANYVAVGGPYANPIRLVKISNATDANVLVSVDGVANHDFIPANGFALYDIASNASAQGGILEEPKYTQVYVKRESGAATTGNLYVTTLYGSTK